MNWDFFFRQLSAGKNIDETCFSFCDDPDEKEHYLGFIPHCDEPYWIGYCDVEVSSSRRRIIRWRNGREFHLRS